MMNKDRVFTTKAKNGSDLILKFKRPSQEVLLKAQLTYRKAFSNNLRAGLILAKEVEKILKERDLWDDSKEKEAQEVRDTISSLEEKLKDKELNQKDGEAICKEISDLRQKLFEINEIITSISENTCESISGEEKNYYLISECIYDNDTDIKVYKNVDDVKTRLDEQMAVDSYRETLIAGLELSIGRELPSDLTDEYAENKWLNSHAEEKTKVSVSKKKTKPAVE